MKKEDIAQMRAYLSPELRVTVFSIFTLLVFPAINAVEKDPIRYAARSMVAVLR